MQIELFWIILLISKKILMIDRSWLDESFIPHRENSRDKRGYDLKYKHSNYFVLDRIRFINSTLCFNENQFMEREKIRKFKGPPLFTEDRFRDSLCKITNSLTSTIRFKVNYTYFLQRTIHASISFVSNIRIFSWKNLPLDITI